MPNTTQGPEPSHSEGSPPGSYWEKSRRPLEILLFLLPFIIAYEIGLMFLLRSEQDLVLTNLAHKGIFKLFDVFGVSGQILPGLLLVMSLLILNLLGRRPWRIEPKVVGFMWIEAILWVIPLYILARVLSSGVSLGMEAQSVEAFEPGLLGRIAIGIGAGLYEELIFRWFLILLVHTIVCDVFKGSDFKGYLFGILISTAAFTIYHPISGVPASTIVFYALGGLYFGLIYVNRHFGIVAAVHALYDVTVVLLHA